MLVSLLNEHSARGKFNTFLFSKVQLIIYNNLPLMLFPSLLKQLQNTEGRTMNLRHFMFILDKKNVMVTYKNLLGEMFHLSDHDILMEGCKHRISSFVTHLWSS